MKFLVDMNLSPHWVGVFHAAGFPAVHWTDTGHSVRASDAEIMAYAHAHDYVVVTRDLDFTTILAASGAHRPSVVQIRANAADPAVIGDIVFDVLGRAETAEALSTGALVSIDLTRGRVRMLPLL